MPGPQRLVAMGLLLFALAWPAWGQFDSIVRRADDEPVVALRLLQAAPVPADAAGRRALALALAEVAARGPDAELAARLRAEAVKVAQALEPALAPADDAYLQALRADRDETAAAATLASTALAAYEAACRARPAGPCEAGPRWRLLQLMAAHTRGQFDTGMARNHARAALALATEAGDAWRQAFSTCELALVANAERDRVRAEQHLARAQALAQGQDDLRLRLRLLFCEFILAADRGEATVADQVLQRALSLAQQGRAPRLQALTLLNLSDRAMRSGRAPAALAAAQQGLALVRPLQLPHLERLLRHNALLAQVALGRQAEARREFEALQQAWAASGAIGQQLSSLREYGDALAQVGELKAALEIHHREVALSKALMAANREAALAELRQRFDTEAQQRHIVQLARDNALKNAELANQGLTRKVWALGAGVLVLAMVLMLLLLRRVRATNKRLERSRARLRVQSERDALTGLANRRHFQAVLQAAVQPGTGAGERGGFAGALLMIDIDHFKHINDDHGHAAGDAVLVEVARRIAAAVRGRDTVARWGGEEFLVLAPELQRADAEALAQRLLQAVAGAPVTLPGGVPLRVAASIGHAVFPLPPHRVGLSPEQALNLVDMALYTAKSQGRNRAVGIVRAEAADAQGLRALESDFERAWREGRVSLRIDPGP